MIRARRAVLFMPGDDLHKISKAAALAVDSVIMDLEDGVAFSRKAEARQTVAHALTHLDFGQSERLVRINPPSSAFEVDDLDAVLPARPAGIVIPKVEAADQVQYICDIIARGEQAAGWEPGSIRVLAIIETARGVLNLPTIAGADPRLDALMFGAEDLAGDIGATRTPEGWEVFYARSAVVTAAAAYGIQAIDTVFVTLDNLDGLRRETQQALAMGYAGKMAIHPRQVPVITEVFTPSEAAVSAARRLIDAHNAHQAAGSGVFVWEGRMVDMPMIRAAERVLARARVGE
jgi:citrate lyase beta subunit